MSYSTMKCAIFCCLLALCVFQIVLADPVQDAKGKINVFKAAKVEEIQKLIAAGNVQQQKKTKACQVNFLIPTKNTVEKVCFPALADCMKNVKTAQQCFKSQVTTCTNKIQFVVDNTKKCITEKSL